MVSLKRSNYVGIIASIVVILISLILFYFNYIDSKILYFILGMAGVILGLPFFVNLLVESNSEKNKDQMFLEFARDLVEGVKSGTPISKSIINVKKKDYGVLTPFVIKLANQISLGIPVKDALDVFSREVRSEVITRAIGLIREAERSGGRIEVILESVTFSVGQIEKLKKERKAAIYNLTVQGYIIFLIFIVMMLIMQFKILPLTTDLNIQPGALEGVDLGGLTNHISGKADIESISNSFLYLLLTQGFFAGLVIGKISEGSVKAGIKHSFILLALSYLVSTGVRIFFV